MMNRLGTVGIIRIMVNKPAQRIDMLDYQNDIMYIYNLCPCRAMSMSKQSMSE